MFNEIRAIQNSAKGRSTVKDVMPAVSTTTIRQKLITHVYSQQCHGVRLGA
jgi:hypothetical protein